MHVSGSNPQGPRLPTTGRVPVTIGREVVGAIIILLLIQLVLAIKAGVFAGVLGDTDVYMWLNRVLQLHESGDWSDHILGRIDPPGGYEQHWTRPFDVLLFSGAWVGALITDFGTALYVWSGLISPALEILALLAVFWALSPLLRGSGNEVLGLVFITQMGVIASFVAGRADHQSLIILLFILSLGCGIRMLVSPCSRLLCYCTGLVSAFAIWVSIESLLFSLVVYLVLGLFWLLGEKETARKLLHYSLSLFLLLICSGLLNMAGRACSSRRLTRYPLFILPCSACCLSIGHLFTGMKSCVTRAGGCLVVLLSRYPGSC